ncbi:MAG: thioredoxin domain-containing protein, partial [Bdellovibrionota bacterium]
ERPDIDQIYQNVAQAMQQGGGWPLTVFLTPDLKPYYGGTYFPPEDRYGRPGFPRVLTALSQAYRDNRAAVVEQSERISDFIAKNEKVNSQDGLAPSLEGVRDALERLLENMDWVNGGMAGAPKFPNPSLLGFLWRYGFWMKHPKAKEAVLITLRQMAKGGVYDQRGGGFHRYSVDETWSVPHFEKMLYDNALLLKIYSEILLSCGNDLSKTDRGLFTEVLSDTVQYVLREMTDPEGGFFSAQDADSEGEEGKFFAWDLKDLNSYLTKDEAEIISKCFGVSELGNFEHGKTVLFRKEEPDLKHLEILYKAKEKLLKERSNRIAPGLDNKLIVSWNGLMISGLSWAALALKGEEINDSSLSDVSIQALTAAWRAWTFVSRTAETSPGRLSSTIQRSKPKGNGYLDDYAFMAAAALDLARTECDEKKLQDLYQHARTWTQSVMDHFRDSEAAGYFFTSRDHELLIHRPKTIFDQAIPSGTAVLLSVIQALNEIGYGKKEWESEPNLQLNRLFSAAMRNPYGCAELLSTSALLIFGVVSVSTSHPDCIIRNSIIYRKSGVENHLSEFVVCHRQTCLQPLATSDEAWHVVLDHVGNPL